jgi:hypothetical protein
MSININSKLQEDIDNVYVNYTFYGIPSSVNYITPAKVIMMNYPGIENNPNFTYTNKSTMMPTNASKYISSVAYISASDFTYQTGNTNIDSNSLQITIRCTSLDGASTIYCIFFVNNVDNPRNQVLSNIINKGIH